MVRIPIQNTINKYKYVLYKILGQGPRIIPPCFDYAPEGTRTSRADRHGGADFRSTGGYFSFNVRDDTEPWLPVRSQFIAVGWPAATDEDVQADGPPHPGGGSQEGEVGKEGGCCYRRCSEWPSVRTESRTLTPTPCPSTFGNLGILSDTMVSVRALGERVRRTSKYGVDAAGR